MNGKQIQEAKQAIRERIWMLLEKERAVNANPEGRIPAFVGADAAAALLAAHPSWQSANVIKAVPDRAQMPVRARAFEEGKRVYMAASKLAAQKPFYLLDPETLAISPREAAERHTAARYARPVDLDEMPHVDLVVCGSVAVNYRGVRLGKGAGYSDIEVALLHEAGLIGSSTLIATTVHELQVVDEELPEAGHDFRVDLIITQDRVIECSPYRRPPGIMWESLTPEAIEAIPVLASRRP
ncbi:5-formyltetrahydrofolate cyclo-ligase [Streptomyces radicis]|uniref:5-formyltetrahydrofolate cyclo-ligase n=1 Tax=Streptomyces radicis TaxID=1750517 RepID=A0A3A9W6A1_9ACTN|nr:5-formyltetrahydrofolate cyclo-ligase [Streptomyces radicis]RKN08339.1 5-formyltetrahydrofolate cyclo-ligase [Streptomyces radicis]RKN21625.1 5-formyltetrahydrofolate cyclo-ligase [Streptomyces radicis]